MNTNSSLNKIESPYLEGIHQPLAKEMNQQNLSLLNGHIPTQLKGIFARNTPNPQFEPIGKYHWFDGDGMVHGFTFGQGEVSYQSKYITTPSFLAERDAKKSLWSGILENPQPGLPTPIKDTANTDLTWHSNQFIASWWLSGTPMSLDTDFNTIGPATFTQDLPRGASISAHPKVDPNTGDMMCFGYRLHKKPYYHYAVVDADRTLKHSIWVDLPHPHIPHDIAITSNYTILMDFPLGWDKNALRRGQRKIGFNKNLPARFGIIPRFGQADEIQWFEADSCYMYHSVRAFELGDEIILSGCRIQDPIPDQASDDPSIARLDIIHLVPYLHQWRFNLKTGQVHEENLDRTPTEFPRINDRYLTQESRYSYHPVMARASTLCFDGIIKYDFHSGQQVHYRYDEDWLGGEVCFAPDPDRIGQEDGGWIVTVVTNAQKQQSKLLLIDAQHVSHGPMACLALPSAIPVGFHAEWASF
jgi:carotenoid cleavage dioxygenase-like enzyme